MTCFSRRTIIKGSPFAAIGWCMPEIWLQAKPTSASPRMPETGSPTRAVTEQIVEEVRQSRAYTIECAMAMPEDKFNFRPVPEVRWSRSILYRNLYDCQGPGEVHARGVGHI